MQTFYPGASPEVITSAITRRWRNNSARCPASVNVLDEFRRRSVITLQFTLSLAIDVAEQQVQAAITGAQNLLPQDLPLLLFTRRSIRRTRRC